MAALTTLANVKQWVLPSGASSDTDDTLLTRLISACSAAIISYLQRPVLTLADYTENPRHGVQPAFTLRNWPVTSISSVTVNGAPIAASNGNSSGWYAPEWDGTMTGKPQRVVLKGYALLPTDNVLVEYEAGYAVLNEPQTVATGTITLTQPFGNWSQDEGVTYTNGMALTKVPSAPAQGQYTCSTAGVYGFNAADDNAGVLVSYSYTPSDIEQACIEWVGERYNYKGRPGMTSQSIGGVETSAYNLKGMPDFIAGMLEPYRKAFPL